MLKEIHNTGDHDVYLTHHAAWPIKYSDKYNSFRLPIFPLNAKKTQ